MKICFLVSGNYISGGLFTVYEHAKRLSRRGHDVVIAFERTRSPLRIVTYPGMECVRTARLDDLADREEFDAAFATWWATAYSIARIRAKHYCYFVQGFEERFYEPNEIATRLLVRKTYEENFHLFTVSETLRDYLRREFNRESTVVRNAVDADSFHRAVAHIPRTGSDRLRVLVEGRGSLALKRVALAFDVVRDVPDVDTVYLTPDGWRERRWRIDHMFTAVPYDEVPAIYASCDVLLKLSREETFARPVLEMFAAGGTAIVSAFDGHAEYIRHGENALVVPIDDREAAVGALRQLVADRDLRARLQAGASVTCREFSWERSNAALDAALQRLPPLPSPRILSALERDLARHRWRRLLRMAGSPASLWHAMSMIAAVPRRGAGE